jgi:hypothetical protein
MRDDQDNVGVARRRRGSPSEAGRKDGVSAHTDDLPLRAELFSVSQLVEHARTLGAEHEIGGAGPRARDGLLSRLAANQVALRTAYSVITEAVKSARALTRCCFF